MKSYMLEEMSYPQIRDAMAGGCDTVIICAASVEQHGPHLSEITDTVFGVELCKSLAERLGNALVAPIIRPGLSNHHLTHPGTVSLRPEVFRGIVEDYVSSYVRHGFKKLILCASHGTNFQPMSRLAEELQLKYPDVKIIMGLKLEDFMALYSEGERMFGLAPGACGGHACDFETSFMLAYYPEYVDMSKAEKGYMQGNTPEFAARLFAGGMAEVSPNGIIGDARAATAAKGGKYFRLFEDALYNSVKAQLEGTSD